MKTGRLYSDVPPTKLRNRDEKFTPAKTSKFWLMVASLFFFNMLQNRFYALRHIGSENYFERDEKYPTIIFAPHSNWWDGIVLYNIAHRICHKEIRLMVEELNRFPLLRRGGAYSVCKQSSQSAVKSLKYSVELLNDLRNLLFIFPQGIICPPNYRPFKFQNGLSYIAQNAVKRYGKVNLIPISIEYCFLRDNRPEVLVEFGKRIELTNAEFDRKEYSKFLEQELTNVCDHQMKVISSGKLDDYEILFKQHLKWYRRIEQRLKSINLPDVAQV